MPGMFLWTRWYWGRCWLVVLAGLTSFGTLPAVADADVGAGLVTWSGLVNLDKPLVLTSKQVLRVLPGTLIRVAHADTTITIQGKLEVSGDVNLPVVFESPKGWKGLVLTKSKARNVIRCARFSGAEKAISVSESRLTIEDSRFENCQMAVAYMAESSGKVLGCQFRGGRNGLASDARSKVEIIRNLFVGFTGSALSLSRMALGNVEDCSFRQNATAIHITQQFPGKIKGNILTDNKVGVALRQTGATPTLVWNRFAGNDRAVEASQFSSPLVERCLFFQNYQAITMKQMSSPKVIANEFFDNGTALDVGWRSTPKVHNNQFEKNRLVLFCDYGSYPKVVNNNIVANELAVKLGDHQSAENILAPKNNDRANSQKRGVALGPRIDKRSAALPKPFIDVSHNWWGENTTLLANARKSDNLALFWDRHDQPYTQGRAGHFQRDIVQFLPVRFTPVAFEPISRTGGRQGADSSR